MNIKSYLFLSVSRIPELSDTDHSGVSTFFLKEGQLGGAMPPSIFYIPSSFINTKTTDYYYYYTVFF